MNFLLGITMGFVSAAMFWVLLTFIPMKYWDRLPPSWHEWRATIAVFIGVLIFTIVVWVVAMEIPPNL